MPVHLHLQEGRDSLLVYLRLLQSVLEQGKVMEEQQ